MPSTPSAPISPVTPPAPLSHWPFSARDRIVGVFTDIDDTLTTEGAITSDALFALSALRQAGIKVVAITGRPVGWSQPFALSWPVDAIVAENGSMAWVGVRKRYRDSEALRTQRYTRLQEVAQAVLHEVPGSHLAEDSIGRETDIAIDHSEFHHLDAAQIEQVVAIMRREGLNASVSSIHINGWFGDHNKLVGARWIVNSLWQRDLDAERDAWVYVGDSTNDELMFEAFAHSVGVANIARFLAQLKHPPRYVTSMERGAGFAQVAEALLAARSARA